MKEIIELNNSLQDVQLVKALLDLVLCVIVSLILRMVYVKYSITRSSKTALARVIPVLSIAVFFIILIVKSSLALSLGLVGALSIVRFRTPIKEPEELVFLFVAIAIGLGYGAGQSMITSLIIPLMLAGMALYLGTEKREHSLREHIYSLEIDSDGEAAKLMDLSLNILGEAKVRLMRKIVSSDGVNLVLAINAEVSELKKLELMLRENPSIKGYDVLTAIENSVS